MQYPPEALKSLAEGLDRIPRQLHELELSCVVNCEDIPSPLVREYMNHGVARRLGVLRYSIVNVFSSFPPSTEKKLDRDALMAVQINLHSFFINLAGIFDNFAWCFVHLHNVEIEIGGRMQVDMFKTNMQRILPPALRDHVEEISMKDWHSKYLKNYRDALAHRIPLYIPPANITPTENERLNEIQAERLPLINAHEWDQLEALDVEQSAIGSPCFTFLHSFSEEAAPRPIMIHPQILSDASTVVEFGSLFLKHWRERA